MLLDKIITDNEKDFEYREDLKKDEDLEDVLGDGEDMYDEEDQKYPGLCVELNIFSPYHIKKYPTSNLIPIFYGEDCLEKLISSGLNDICVYLRYPDDTEILLAKKLTKPIKKLVDLFKTSYNYQKHVFETNWCADYAEINIIESGGGLDWLSCIWSYGDEIIIDITGKKVLVEDEEYGTMWKSEGVYFRLSKKEFWNTSTDYGSDYDNKIIPLIRDLISPVLKKYDTLGIEVDRICWQYVGDPTIDWSCITKDVVNFYEGIQKIEGEGTYSVYFVMSVDSSKCKKDISVLRKMYSVYLDEKDTDDLEELYLKNGKEFNEDVVNKLISKLRNTPKNESIKDLGITDYDVLSWYKEIGCH